MSLDLKICGGTIVDGTGGARFTADIGVRQGRIVELGKISSAARRQIDADGALVTPGFIDMHTHYDAQVLWDSELMASSRHGVTTAVMGNCGVGCAPFADSIKEPIRALLEGVEDIPGAALDAALDWDWSTFSSYLDRVAARPHSINLAANVTHAPLRLLAMGSRALDGSAPTAEDVVSMQLLLREALDAGAVGFSTDRIALHQMANGGHVPDWFAPASEVLALTRTLAGCSGRPMQYASDYGMVETEEVTRRELALLAQIVEIGVPVYTPLQQYPIQGGWRRLTREIGELKKTGARVRFEASSRAIGALLGLQALIHPFSRHPSYMAIKHLPLEDRVACMREPGFKAQLLAEAPVFGPGDERIRRRLEQLSRDADKLFIMGTDADYEPDRSQSIKACAEREGVTLEESFYEALTAADGLDFLYMPLANFADGCLDEQREVLSHPDALLSFGDAGAHLAQICDAAYSSFCLAHWARDRAVGLPLERLVHQMTGAQAELFGFAGRGRLQLGAIADINVIDHDKLKLGAPFMLHDIPGGGARLMQHASGYLATLLGGVTTVEHDALTGALPGTVLKSC